MSTYKDSHFGDIELHMEGPQMAIQVDSNPARWFVARPEDRVAIARDILGDGPEPDPTKYWRPTESIVATAEELADTHHSDSRLLERAIAWMDALLIRQRRAAEEEAEKAERDEGIRALEKTLPGHVFTTNRYRKQAAEAQYDAGVRATWLSVNELYRLNSACRSVRDAVDGIGVYLVGSSLVRKDYRDVDVRAILDDADFTARFPNPAWLRLANAAISDWLAGATGLDVDFQFQSLTESNSYPGRVHPIGHGHHFDPTDGEA